jgi:hypothetical protein
MSEDCQPPDDTLNDFERQLRGRLRTRWDCAAPRGFSRHDIEQTAGIDVSRLPAVYPRFLETCGREAGSLFRDYNWSLSSRVSRNAELRLVCQECDLRPPAPAFSFLDYIGDYFWCFGESSDPNPVVMRHDSEVQWLTLPVRLDEFLLTWEQLE